jgi:general stress protein YciG
MFVFPCFEIQAPEGANAVDRVRTPAPRDISKRNLPPCVPLTGWLSEKEEFHVADKTAHSTHTEHSTHKEKADGKKGVTREQVGGGKDDDPNNFANNPDRAAAAGRKGGEHSHKRD